ncbi:hypothetical protein MmiHf6_06140 [Methanimicrococcus hongohii]|uniref:Uncharacterized protein n=1 Tax=Methanimicrococcus hongohii TaxID=3028295 RepID=A0AA96UZ54_9EURY|nr:hypothetical protein [Methanimicrococcus sp. Hf6]WNY23309.1 hypothetical protein MmiHf6_06140 [Methanimicrococcus sp. Hf6]
MENHNHNNHNRGHECNHDHSHDCDHDHSQEHSQECGHDYSHEHSQECGHDHSHEHLHDSHDRFHESHNHDAHARGYDRPLIDGADDDSSCACSCHPEDESAKKIVERMVFQLDEVIALSSGPVYSDFITNENLQLRLIDLLNKVEEEALSLPDDYKKRKPKADWEFLQTLNIQITHPEFGMNPETLWDIVRLEIPFQNKMLGIIINGCSHEQ